MPMRRRPKRNAGYALTDTMSNKPPLEINEVTDMRTCEDCVSNGRCLYQMDGVRGLPETEAKTIPCGFFLAKAVQ